MIPEQIPTSHKVLYITYDGLLEPLGQSQVLNYLIEIQSMADVTFVVLSFEKSQDFQNAALVESTKLKLQRARIEWCPLTYHKRPPLLSTFIDIYWGTFTALDLIRRHKIEILHIRSYVPAVIALLVSKFYRRPWIFDMRGFWGDERADIGQWSRSSTIYRCIKYFEKLFIRNSSAVVSLTHRGLDEIRAGRLTGESRVHNLYFIPTCADLEKFKPLSHSSDFQLGYVGTVGNWYDFPKTIQTWKFIRAKNPDAKFEILNKGEHDKIKVYLKDFGDVPIRSASSEQVAQALASWKFGVFFIKPSYSKIASAPTRLAEHLASGIPVLTGAGIGDVDEILTKYNVVVVADEDLEAGVAKILELAEDPDISRRCRSCAEEIFSLQSGSKRYLEIYDKLKSKEP